MNDEQIDNLLNQSFFDDALSPGLNQTFLEQSTQALSQTYRRRCWMQRVAYGGGLLLALMIGLIGGPAARRQTSSQLGTEPSSKTVSVAQDMVTWLDAAHLFAQLGMEQRAAFAYERASEFSPSRHGERLLTGTSSMPTWPKNTQSQSLLHLLAKCQTQQLQTESIDIESSKKMNVHLMLAQSMGE